MNGRRLRDGGIGLRRAAARAGRLGSERGYEGYVVKDEAIVYQQGPTRSWLKVKVPGWTVEGGGWQRRVSVAPSAR